MFKHFHKPNWVMMKKFSCTYPEVLMLIVQSRRSDYVLKLKKNLYGLKQAAYNWSELLKAGLFKLGFKQRKVDPCLYL